MLSFLSIVSVTIYNIKSLTWLAYNKINKIFLDVLQKLYISKWEYIEYSWMYLIFYCKRNIHTC